MLMLHNSRTRQKEAFVPIDPKRVTMYVCGPTVYDRIHLGNARPLVVFDVLYRLLRNIYTEVMYVRNITDVDDKINERAKEQGIPIQVLTEKTAQWFHEDVKELGCLPPSHEPKATAYIQDMITLITQLIDKKAAYVHGGHVLFDVEACPQYGQLAHRDWEDMKAGARVEIAPYKKNPVDFVLWKPSKEGEIGWESPWGYGRPGWHIECSAMSHHFLGPLFDIHGGGSDLLFPHHENERAQSCSFSGGEDCARYWMHNGMLIVDGQKMSKSLGNFMTLRQALDKASGEVIRWALLSSHYRQTLDWNAALLYQARTCLDHIYRCFQEETEMGTVDPEVTEYLADDLNTPCALSALQRLARAINKETNPAGKKRLAGQLLASARSMGFLGMTAEKWFQGSASVPTEAIQRAIEDRKEARLSKDYAKADAVRQWLSENRIILEDHSDGTTTWSVRD